MASPISHIIYAKKYFDAIESGSLLKNNSDKEKFSCSFGKIDKDEFFLGCLFPDIRRIDEGVSRKDTHLKFYPLDLDFFGLNSFEAGWKFHLFCDMRRDEILNGKKINFYKNADELSGLSGKILEDKLVYSDYDNWEKLTGYLNNPPYFETVETVNKNTYNLWYAILAKYLERQPDAKSISSYLVKQPRFAERKKNIIEMVERLEKNKAVVGILENISDRIV